MTQRINIHVLWKWSWIKITDYREDMHTVFPLTMCQKSLKSLLNSQVMAVTYDQMRSSVKAGDKSGPYATAARCHRHPHLLM